MKRWCILCLAAVLLLTGLSACGSGTAETSDAFQLWYLAVDQDGSPSLEGEFYSGEESVSAVMQALLSGPSAGSGLHSAVPNGTQMLNWNRTGSLIWVDLSREYGELTGVDLTLADYCITLTLTQLKGVDSVRITVDNEELSERNKQVFRRDDVVLSGAEEEPVELTAALCFRRSGGNQLGQELRVFRLTENQSAPLAVLQALLAGPQEVGLEALLPTDLEVYSARVESGICYADFSAALLSEIPETEEEQQLAIRSVVDSLCSLGAVQAVQILVEGEPLTQYGQVDVSKPLS